MALQVFGLLRGGRTHSVLIACVVASLVCLRLPIDTKTRVASVLSILYSPFTRLAGSVVELVNARTENVTLRRIATELMLDRQQLIQYKHENDRLRELLNLLKDFGYEDRFEMIPATVTAMPGDRVVESLTIDKGSDHELKVDMAVVVPEGLVGKLSWVLPRKAVIDPLTGPISGVGVVVERNRVRGVVWARYGLSTEPVTWTMDYVDLHEDVVPGDRVITSGLGGVYPPGLLVGTVRSVSQDPVEKRVLIDRAVDVSEIEQVFVLAPKYLLSGSHEETEANRQRKLALRAELERTMTNGASK